MDSPGSTIKSLSAIEPGDLSTSGELIVSTGVLNAGTGVKIRYVYGGELFTWTTTFPSAPGRIVAT